MDDEKFIKEAILQIKEAVGEGHAIIACSGGVDSTVAAALSHTALGDQLTCIYVDTGLMRLNENEETMANLKSCGLPVYQVDAAEHFIADLKDVVEPEEKRKLIGKRFIRVFEEEAEKVNATHLVQGTIAPDWIESGGGLRDTIKSHHNVGGLPEDMALTLVEPLRDLYKDEVRSLGRILELPVSERQPFPGPGLAIRVLGPVTADRVEIVRGACAIVEAEIEKAAENGEVERPWQYFAALLPVYSVGVQGDLRAYGETIAIRAVDSLDGMSANFSPLSAALLGRISTKITNQFKDKVNRVVYDVTHKPPATIEWE